jgi:hypothetical protein
MQEVYKNNTCVIPKDYVGLFLLVVPSWIFSSLAMLCIAVSQIATWILV